jgi:hypothetical protein
MMMSAGLGFGINSDSTGPKLARARTLGCYGGAPLHSKSLGRAVIQLVAPDDSHSIRSPSAGAFTHAWSRRALIHTNAISVTIPAPDR